MPNNVEVILSSEEATERLGFEVASLLDGCLIVALYGPLGAGKTTFARGVGRALGVKEPVTSPTFTKLNEYCSGRLPLSHLDLYRLLDSGVEHDSVVEMWEEELEELTACPGVVLIEWPDVVSAYINKRDHLVVELNYPTLLVKRDDFGDLEPENSRTACIKGNGKQPNNIVQSLTNIYFS